MVNRIYIDVEMFGKSGKYSYMIFAKTAKNFIFFNRSLGKN